jgi:hypothetical protein
MKICSKCKIEKSIEDFSFDKRLKNGRQSTCKECKKIECQEYRKTKIGLLTTRYNNQVTNSIRRKLSSPSYNKKEFIEWILNQSNFEKLYNDWVNSGYDKDFTPSIDRLDDYKPYSFDNIQLVTWKENNEKGIQDRITGKNTKKNTKVIQLDLQDNIINTFDSIKEAIQKTKVKNISSCCSGKRKTAGGFKWKYNN